MCRVQFDTATGVRPSPGAATSFAVHPSVLFPYRFAFRRCCGRDGRAPAAVVVTVALEFAAGAGSFLTNLMKTMINGLHSLA